MRYWTSDQHFSHRNIINFCDRPFRLLEYPHEPDVHHMNTEIVKRYNSVVLPDDEVWMLGDLALGNTVKNLKWAGTCAGTKTFLTGNHDRNFRKNGVEKPGWDKKYADLGEFSQILHGNHTVVLANGTQVIVSHFPYIGDSRENERYALHRPQDDGKTWLLHGHVHEKWRQRGRMINVGVDAWGGYPVSEPQIIELIEAGPEDRDPIDW